MTATGEVFPSGGWGGILSGLQSIGRGGTEKMGTVCGEGPKRQRSMRVRKSPYTGYLVKRRSDRAEKK